MNPYITDPTRIPATDRFAAEPLHVMSTTSEGLAYLASVLDLCDTSVRIYENPDGGRDVFALGGVIVKSSHLNYHIELTRDYSYADANEVAATAIARAALQGIRVSQIFFASKLNGQAVLVQERIPGVGLNVAWDYLSPAQEVSFKQQTRELLRQMHKVHPLAGCTARSYVVPDPDPIIHASDKIDPDMSFMHNDFSLSNTIVYDDRIVGLVDWEMAGFFGWEMAGFFGWKTAAEVHAKLRTPQAGNYAHLGLPAQQLADILFWNDLYEIEP
ncbi:hypothetical protein B0T22DRAFT_528957 [Podospora appendiculata]|uniref:Aminoglycoside phosphotransferase domain-containing protein n=1 Tax=Podospora appendiculata TaxID=314037 RepID=A0AAE0XD36_9PEZI|nr:hypothetical protein B0T22DRAFT_528957 [Podospora appendiculata]